MRIVFILAFLAIFSAIAIFCITTPFFSYKEAVIAEVIKETSASFSLMPIYNGKLFLRLPLFYAWIAVVFCKIFSFLPFSTKVLLRLLSLSSIFSLLGLCFVMFEKKEEYFLFLIFFLAIPDVLKAFISISPVPFLAVIDFLVIACACGFLEKESVLLKRLYYLFLGIVFASQGLLACLALFTLSLVFVLFRSPKKTLKLLFCFSAPILFLLPVSLYVAVFYFKFHNFNFFLKLLAPLAPHPEFKFNLYTVERELFSMLKEFFAPLVTVLILPFVLNSEDTGAYLLYAVSFFILGLCFVLFSGVYPFNPTFLLLSRLFLAGFFACLLAKREYLAWALRVSFLWLAFGIFIFSLETTCLADKITYRTSIIKSVMESIAEEKVAFWKRINPIMLYYLGAPRPVINSETQIANLHPRYIISRKSLSGTKIYRILFDPYTKKLYYILKLY